MSTAELTPTAYIQAKNDVKFAYRRFGAPSEVPIVVHIHFRGSMDFWDPRLLNNLAKEREVIVFDNAGVGRSTGEIAITFQGWAKTMIAFIEALGLKEVDLLGFSMGGLAVLEVALAAPHLVRKLIIAGSKASVPSAGPIPGILWPQEVAPPEFVTKLAQAISIEEGREALRYSCFPQTEEALASFDAYWKRLEARSIEPAQLQLLPMESGGGNQVASVMDSETPQPNASFDRLAELSMPVLVMNGSNDVLIPTSRSWELVKQINNAQLIIYPRSGHGFIWQYSHVVAQDVNNFLNRIDF